MSFKLGLFQLTPGSMLPLNTLHEYHAWNLLVGNPKVARKSREVVSVNNDESHSAPRRQSNMACSPEPSITDMPVFEAVNHSPDHLDDFHESLDRDINIEFEETKSRT